MEKPDYHQNLHSGNIIFGSRLQPGDKLEKNDVYASTDGKWQKCPCPGVTLVEGVTTVFVRPQTQP